MSSILFYSGKWRKMLLHDSPSTYLACFTTPCQWLLCNTTYFFIVCNIFFHYFQQIHRKYTKQNYFIYVKKNIYLMFGRNLYANSTNINEKLSMQISLWNVSKERKSTLLTTERKKPPHCIKKFINLFWCGKKMVKIKTLK